MNKVFRIIWSYAQQAWVVVSELTKSRGKGSVSVDKRVSSRFSTALLEQQSGFSLNMVTKAILVGVLGLGFSVPSFAVTVTTNGDAAAVGNDRGNITDVVIGRGATSWWKANARGHGNSVILGYNAQAIDASNSTWQSGPNAGQSKRGDGSSNVIIGSGAQGAEDAVAIGANAYAKSISSLAIGRMSEADGEFAISIGNGQGTDSIGKATSSRALAASSIAIGRGATVYSTGAYATAIGLWTEARGYGSLAMAPGASTTATANGGIALGRYAKSEELHAVAIGPGSLATALRSVAIGTPLKGGPGHSPAGATSIGTDAIALGTSALAGGDRGKFTAWENGNNENKQRLYDEFKASINKPGSSDKYDEQIAIGKEATASKSQDLAIGAKASATGAQAIAVGGNTVASGYGAISIGGDDLDGTDYQNITNVPQYLGTEAKGAASIAIGGKSKAEGSGSVAIGPVAKTSNHKEGVAIGAKSSTTNEYGVAVGSGATAGSYAVAVGKSANASQTGASAFGENAQATAERATALGNNAVANIQNGVALGYMSKTTRNTTNNTGWKQNTTAYTNLAGTTQTANYAAVSVGNDAGNSIVTRQITGVAAGSSDTDAVNLAQLKALTLELKSGSQSGHVTLSNEKLNIVGENGITVNLNNDTVTIRGSGTTSTAGATALKAEKARSSGSAGGRVDESGQTSGGPVGILTAQTWGSEGTNGNYSGEVYSGENLETLREDNKNIHIGLKVDPKFNSVQYGDNGSKITKDNNGNLKVTKADGSSPTKITNVANGENDKDAVNVSQLNAVKSETDNIYFHANIHTNGVQGDGDVNTNKGKITEKAGATGAFSVTGGYKARASGNYSLAIGNESKSEAADSVAVGNNAKVGTGGTNSVAVGAHITLNSDHAVAVGYKAAAGGIGSVAVGEQASTTPNRSTALGNNTVVTVGGGVALGYGSNASTAGDVEGLKQAHSVTTGASTVENGFKSTRNVNGNDIGAVSVGTGSGNNLIKRQIVNVAAGTTDTDAVNVAQLKSLTMKIGGDQNTETPAVGIWDGKLEVKGASGEIKTSASGSTITVSLDEAIKTQLNNARAGSLIFKGEKTGNGTQADTNGHKWTANEDKTVTIASNERYTVDSVNYNGDNIEIYRKNDNSGEIFHVLMKDAPTFSSVQYGSNGPKITNDGSNNLKVTGANGSSSVKITNVANGEQNNDAVNFSQLSPVKTETESIYFHTNTGEASQGEGSPDTNKGKITDKAGATAAYAITAGVSTKATHSQAVAIGRNVTAVAKSAIAIGNGDLDHETDTMALRRADYDPVTKEVTINPDQTARTTITATKASGEMAIAIGSRSISSGLASVSLGAYAHAVNQQAISIGAFSAASGMTSTAIGTFAASKGKAALAVGGAAKAIGDGSSAIGSNTKAEAAGSIALGRYSEATVAGNQTGTKQTHSAYAGSIGSFTSTTKVGNDNIGAVSVGKSDGSITRQIVGVAAGTADTDATNVAQLKSLTMKIEGNENKHNDADADLNSADRPKVGLWEGSLKVKGEGAVKTKASGDTITISLDQSQLPTGSGVVSANTYFHTNTGVDSQGEGDANTNLGKIEEKAGATGKYAVAAGINTKATANSAIAIGSGLLSNPHGKNILKAKYDSAKKEMVAGATVVPDATETISSGDMSVAIGGLAKATGDVSTALGAYSHALGNEAVALGTLSAATGAAAVSIGSFSAANGIDAVAIGWGAKARADYSLALGLNAKAFGQNTVAIGKGATAGIENDTTNISAVAIGESSAATHKDSIAIGKGAKAKAEKAISIGTGNTVSGAKSGAIGDPNTVSGAASYVMGNDNTVTHTKAFVLGNNITTGADDSVYLGDGSAVNTGDSSGGVTGAVASGEINGITYGNFAATTPVGVVTVGAANKERRIQNVAAGLISKTSTDAINGSQLYLTNNVIGNIAKTIKPILGGDADYKTSGDEAGKFTMTNIGDTNKNNIHDAIIAAKSVVEKGKNISSVDVTDEADGSKKYTVNAYKTTVAKADNDTLITVSGGEANNENVLAYKVGVTKGSFAVTTDGKLSQQAAGVATVNDVATAVNAGYWKAKSGTTTKNIKFGDTIEFVNGDATTAKLSEDGKVSYDVKYDGSTITKTNDGKLKVNIDNLPKTTFKVKANEERDDQAATVSDQDVVTFKSGTNIDVSRNGKEFTISTSDTPTFNSVTITGTPTEGNQAVNKTYVDGLRTTVQSSDESIRVEDTDTNANKYAYDIKVNYDKVAQNAKLSYQANKTGKKEVALSTGLDFTNTDNITASVEANGVVKHSLNENLKGISSIANSAADDATKISLTGNGDNKVVNVHGAKITNVAKPTENSDAANKKYVDDTNTEVAVGNGLALSTSTNTTGGKKYTVSLDTSALPPGSIKYKGEGDTDLQDARTVELNTGLTFKNGNYTVATTEDGGNVKIDLNDAAKTKLDNAGQDFKVGVSETPADTDTTIVVDENANNKRFDIVGTGEITTTIDGRKVEVALSDETKTKIDKIDDLDTKVNQGITFVADAGSQNNKKTNPVKLGSELKIAGGTNIGTTVSDDKGAININLDDNIVLTHEGNITFGNEGTRLTTLDNDGLTVKTGTQDGAKTIEVTKTGIKAGDKKITNVAAGDVKDNSTDAINGNQLYNFIKVGESAVAKNGVVKFVDGTGTTVAKTDNGEIKVNVNTGTSTVGEDGKAKPTSTDHDNKIATVKNITDSINATFWKATTGKEGTGKQADGSADKTAKVKAGDEVKFKAGDNLTIKQDGTGDRDFTYSLNKDVDLKDGSLKFNKGGETATSVQLDEEGLTITKPANSGDTKSDVKLTANGLDNGKNKITNVAKPEADTDAANKKYVDDGRTVVEQGDNIIVTSQKDDATGKTTYTVKGKKTTVSKADNTSPITVTSDEETSTGVTNYKIGIEVDNTTIEVKNGKLASKVVDTDKSAKVIGSELVTVETATTARDEGITKVTDYTVKVKKGAFGNTTDGKIVAGSADGNSTGVATVGDVVSAVNSGYWKVKSGNVTKNVKFGDTIEFVAGNATTASITDEGKVSYSVNVDNSTIKIDGDGKLYATLQAPQTTTLNVSDTEGTVTVPTGGDDKFVTATNIADAINKSGWIATSDSATSKSEALVKAGEKVKFEVEGTNLTLAQDGKKFTYGLANTLNLTTNGSVKFGDNGTILNNSGLTIPATANGKPAVSLTSNGLNNGGNQITNVASGENVDSNGANIGDVKRIAGASVEKVKQAEGTDNLATVTPVSTETNSAYGKPGTEYVVSVSKNTVTNVAKEAAKASIDVKGTSPISVTSKDEKGKKTYTVSYNATEAAGVTNLSYKADGQGTQTTTLANGLNFTSTDNITTETGNNGVVKHNLNSELKGITSIANGDTTNKNNGAKITLSNDPNNKTVDVNEAKITNVAAGAISDSSKEAINGTQLHNFIKVGGNAVESNGSVTFADGNHTTINAGTTGTIKVDVKTGTFGNLTSEGKLSKATDGVATVNDVVTEVNKGYWTAKVNGNTEVAKVKFGDSVNFVDGKGTTAAKVDNGIAYNVNLAGDSTITVEQPTGDSGAVTLKVNTTTLVDGNNDGKIDDPTTGNGTKMVSADALKTALNTTAWIVTSDKEDNGTKSGQQTEEKVKAGETVTLKAGDNLDIKQAGKSFTYSLSKTINLTQNGSVTFGDNGTTLNNSGLTIPATANGKTAVSLTSSGLNNGGNRIVNVATPTENTDAANKKYVDDSRTEVVQGKNVTVTRDTTNTAKNVYTIDAEKTTVSAVKTPAVDTNSQPTENKYLTVTGTPNTIDKVTDYAIDLTRAAKEAIEKAKSLNVTGTDGIKVENPTDKPNEFVVKADTKTIQVGEDGKVVEPAANATADKKLITADEVAKAINKTGFKLISGDNGGTNNTGNDLKTNGEIINPGDTLTMKAGKNIVVTHTAQGNITFATTATPEFTSVQFEDNGPKISKSADGDLKVGKGDGGNTAAKITNVADGDVKDNSTDVVTGKQLHNYLKVDGESAHKNGSINFTDGTTTNVTAKDGAVTIEVNTTALSTTLTTNNGSVTNPTNTDGSKFATASSVASAINEVYWSATSGTATGGTQDGTAQTANVQAGNTVTFKAGKNLTIKQDGTGNRDFTYSLNSALKDITSIANGEENTGTKITLSSTSKEVNVGGAKISNVATPTGNTDAATKKYVDDSRTTVTSGSDVLTITDANENDTSKTNKAYTITLNADKLNSAANLSYKANNKDGKTTPLSTGLDFTNTTNITASVEAGGVVKHTLNSELKGITSIASKADGTGTKITLSTADNDNKVTLNDAKLTGLTAGDVTDTSKDAVTGKQLKDLADEIGVGLETDSTTLFKKPEFTKLKATSTDTTEPKEAKTVVAALDETRVTVNKGLKFKGEEADGTKTITKQLGETLTITSGDITKDGVEYKASNLRVESDGTNIEIGLKENPEFKAITVKEGNNTTTVGATSIKVGDNTASTTDKPVTITAGENNEGGSISNLKTTLTTPDAATSGSKPNSFTTTNAATLGDVLNAGWNLQANGSAVDFVQPYDKVNFTGEKGVAVTSEVANGKATIKVSTETESLEVVDGKAKLDTVKQLEEAKKALEDAKKDLADNTGTVTNDEIDKLQEKVTKLEADKAKAEEKLVTAKEVADVINEAGWKATSDVEGSGKRADSTTKSTEFVKVGELVTFKAGDNLIIKQEGKNFTYALNPELTNLTSAEFKTNGGTESTKLTKGGLTTTDGTTTTTVNPNTIKVGDKNGADGQPAADSNPITISSTAKDGKTVNTITGLTNNLPETVNMVGGSKKQDAPTAADIADKGKNAATVSDILNAGWNLQGNGAEKDFVRAYDTVNFVDGSGTTVAVTPDITGSSSKVKVSVDTGKLTVTNGKVEDPLPNAAELEKKLADAKKALQDELNKPMDNSGVADHSKVLELAAKVEEVEKEVNAAGLNKVATIKEVADAINNSGWIVTSTTAEGTDKGDKLVTAGEKVSFEVGNNLKLTQDNKTFTYSLNPVLTGLTSAEFKGTDNEVKTEITKEGITITPATPTAAGKSAVSLTKDGLDNGGNKVTNVAKGDIAETSKDAVNGSQLKDLAEKVGVGLETGSTTAFKKPTFTKLKENKDTDVTAKEAKTVVEALEETRTTVNKGLIFVGENDNETSKNITKQLGEKVKFISGDFIVTTTGNNTTTSSTAYKGENLAVISNGSEIVVGMKDALTSIKSIANGEDNTGTKITLASGKKEVSVNSAKVTNLAEGNVSNDSTDATTGKQLYNLVKINGTSAVNNVENNPNKGGINFVNGATTTIAKGNDGNIKVEVQGTTLTVNSTGNEAGKVVTPTVDADKVKFVNAENLATALNSMGFNVESTGSNLGANNQTGKQLIKAGDTVKFEAGDGLLVKRVGSTFTYQLGDTLKTNNLTVGEKGENGKEGKDGTIGVNGKDGSAVTINGKDGSIGLNGANGTNGVTIKGGQGQAGVDGADSEQKTRIVYEYKDAGGNKLTEHVATLNDGLKFTGNNSDTVNKHKLNTLVTIKGEGVDKENAKNFVGAAGNINVKANGTDTLEIQLAKAINLTKDGSVTTGNTTMNDSGITITQPTNAGEGKSNVTLTASGLDNGGNQITKVGSNLPPTDSSSTAQSLPTITNAPVTTNAATVGDVLNAGWNLQDNGSAVDFVKPYDTVNFQNGMGTLVTVANQNGTNIVQVDVDSVDITVETNGKVTGPVTGDKTAEKLVEDIQHAEYLLDEAEKALTEAEKELKAIPNDQDKTAAEQKVAEARRTVEEKTAEMEKAYDDADKAGLNKVATAQNVADAINNSGWQVTAGQDGSGVVEGKATTLVKPSDLVTLKAGNNLKLVQSGKDFIYSLNPALTDLTSAEFKTAGGTESTKLTTNGIVITPTTLANGKTAVSLTKDGLDNGGNTISNVASNLPETRNVAEGDKAITTSQDAPTADEITRFGNNAATVKDVLNAGWNLKANDDDLDFVRPYDSVKFQDGAGTFVTTATDGKESIIQIDIDNGTLTTTENGKVVGMVTAEKSKELTDNIIDAETELRDAKDALTELGDNATEDAKNTAIQAVKDAEAKVQKAYDDADEAGLSKVATAQNVAEAINNSGWRVTAGKTTGAVKGEKETLVKPSDLVTFKAGDNIVIEQDGSNFTFALSDTVKTNTITVGEKGADGKDGVDGTIGVNGKDGSAVVINGKDGSIGLNGKDGANGVTIKGDQGPAGVDGKDGEQKTRIVYEYKDPSKPDTPIKEEIATLKDGQKYSGDNYKAAEGNKAEENVIAKKLNERLEIKGGATEVSTNNNIGVIAENGVLNVRLAKNIDLGADGSVTTGNTKVDNNGITIKKPANAGEGKSDVKLTANGLSNGGNKITNVAAGTADTDAVNMKQLNEGTAAAKTEVSSDDGSVSVTEKLGGKSQTIYDLSVAKSKLKAAEDKRTVKAEIKGNAFVTGEEVANAINTTTAAARTEVTDGRNTQVVATTGGNGQDIYNVSVSGLPMEYATEDGKAIVNNGGKFYLEEEVSKPDGSVEIKLTPVVNRKGQFFTETKTENPDGTINISRKPIKAKINLVNETPMVLGNVAEGVADTDAVNVKQLKATKTEVEAGTNVVVTPKVGDNGQDIYRVSVEGALSNITSISNGDTKISLGKDETGGKVVNMNGARITNIGDGREEGDVVNVRQLNKVVSSVNAGFNQLSKDIGRVDSHARAGIASAGAMANLPQIYLPGKSAISVSGAQYRGQAAYAIGYSRISDNGKWLIRASASSNTQKDTMVAAGASYVW